MIDICAGNLEDSELSEGILKDSSVTKPKGNFQMCAVPTNPIGYLKSKGFDSIWRFILTHPDMDHMEGIKNLFEQIRVSVFWDCGIRRKKPDFPQNGPYREDDWDFYERLINNNVTDTKVISPRAGDNGMYWNADNEAGDGEGDYLSILSPSNALVKLANDTGDINDASYVIIYRSSAGKIIFAGDSNDNTWKYILENHENLVTNTAILFAPHHGRKSDRDYSFLDVVKPRISFFGCAESDNLAYSAWDYRKRLFFTNNQCGNVHAYPEEKKVRIYIENRNFAEKYTKSNTREKDGYWFLCEV